MMKSKLFAGILILLLAACQKETISMGTGESQTFYVDSKGASMQVLVEGNLISHVFLIFVHGGPGSSSLPYNTDYISSHLEKDYALVYLDQRNAGASQGNFNGSDLNLTQMTTDLRNVILVIKKRYGDDSKIFLLGHSFGGLLTASYLTTYYIQGMVDGWLFVDGIQNYPLNDTLTREKLLYTGEEQIRLSKHVKEWQEIVTWCTDHPGNFTLDQSMQMETFAGAAETYLDEVTQIDPVASNLGIALKEHWPLTSMLMNYLYSSNAAFIKDLYKTAFTSQLNRVKVPTLLLFGEYDFTCPLGLGDDIFNRIGTLDVSMEISYKSGHEMMFQDPEFFCREVAGFIELHR